MFKCKKCKEQFSFIDCAWRKAGKTSIDPIDFQQLYTPLCPLCGSSSHEWELTCSEELQNK
jgi:hypothetical protein